jgi:hypothetical protein
MADSGAQPTFVCVYCATERPWSQIRAANAGLVCRDSDACQKAEDKLHRAHLSALRRRQREGDELTDAEKQELADA